MKCPKCGNEVDTSLCVACPNCRTRMPNVNSYQPEIGMQDSFGNKMTVGGSLGKPLNNKTKIKLILSITVVILVVTVGICIYLYNKPRTREEAIILARQDAKEVVNQQLKYKNLNTWYANTYVDSDGNNKFIIYCDVYGEVITGGYYRIQMYVGIELNKRGSGYTYWTTANIYPNGDSTPNEYESAYVYVQELKNKMGW